MAEEFQIGDIIQHNNLKQEFVVMKIIPSGNKVLLQVGNGRIAQYNFWAHECELVGKKPPKSLMTW